MAGLSNFLTTGTFLWLGQKSLGLILSVVAARLALGFGATIIDKILQPPPGKKYYLEEKRARTLNTLLKSILRYGIYFIITLVILDLFELPTASILASAGILGLAVGFGAQNLVRDVITGFFLIFEDQFAVGDYIAAAGVEGIVEEIGFRVTKIRDFGGQLHIIPNGGIEKVSNFSTGNMRVLVEVQVSYEESLEEAIRVLTTVCAETGRDLPTVVEGPSVLGVQELADSGVKLLIWAKTVPMEQWAVAREIRRRAKEALDRAGIEIPYPHTVIVTPPGGKDAARREFDG